METTVPFKIGDKVRGQGPACPSGRGVVIAFEDGVIFRRDTPHSAEVHEVPQVWVAVQGQALDERGSPYGKEKTWRARSRDLQLENGAST